MPSKTVIKTTKRAAAASSAGRDPIAPLTARALGRATLARQLLLAREKAKVAGVIERLAGMQAQLPRPPYIGLWTRLTAFRREDLAHAVAKREVVRATMWRGTLHLVTARDYLALRAVIQPGLTAGLFAVLRERATGMEVEPLVAAAKPYFAEAPRTFTDARELLARLPAASRPPPNVDVRAMGFAVRLTLPLLQVPSDDATRARWGFATTPAFTLAESWLGEPIRAVGPDANDAGDASGVAALALRYLAAFGPATARDMQMWSGLPGSLVRAAFDALEPRLATLRDDRERVLFDLPGAPRPGEDVDAPVRFLPEFDNLLLAHVDRKRVLADVHRKRVYLPGIRVAPTFLVDGVVAGTWGIERKKSAATLTIVPFAALAKATQRVLETEGDALARFVEADATSIDVRFAKPRP